MSSRVSGPPPQVPWVGVSATHYQFTARVWEYDGPSAWHFVSLPEEVADEILERFGDRARGFGSVRVEVTVGATTWRTSIFPDTKRGTYVLPIKRPVRVDERLVDGSSAAFGLLVLD